MAPASVPCCGICCAMIDYSPASVCAVVVTYQPELTALRALIAAVKDQVGAIVVIDNASGGNWQQGLGAELLARGGAVLAQSHNEGLAAAQNIGIAWGRARGFQHVLLLDQDSEPGKGMVAALLAATRELSATARVGAVGSRFHDPREARAAPFVRIGFPLNRKVWCEGTTQKVACDFLISSGTLIPMTVLDQVGGMAAGLFIDNVDLEWCFRARARGYALYGVCAATLRHRLGDDRRRVPLVAGGLVVHSPRRLYYMMRNRLVLYRMPHTPRAWIAQDVPRVLAKLFLFGVIVSPRGLNLRFMLRGLWDGARGHDGVCTIP